MFNQTSFDQFVSLAQSAIRLGKRVAVISGEILCDFITPVGIYQALRTSQGSALLESVNKDVITFFGFQPYAEFGIYGSQGKVEYYDVKYSSTLKTKKQTFPKPLEAMESLLRQFSPEKGQEVFAGGAIGYFGHEAICLLEPTVPRHPKDELNLPDARFQFFKHILVFHHTTQTLHLIVNVSLQGVNSNNLNELQNLYDDALTDLGEIEGKLRKANFLENIGHCADTEISSNHTKEEYEAVVRKSMEYIASGDVFQVVISQRHQTRFSATHSLDFYRLLRKNNPSPYLFHVDFGGDVVLVGASPEVMVRVKNRQMLIRPLAGTRRRGKDKAENDARVLDLSTDTKEIAEHIMLVDLARNDVGKYCVAGSVEVTGLMVVELYGEVWHMRSDVTGKLKENVKLLEAILGSLPAGTLSGAPKVRALQIISELEASCRGPYGGAVGWFTDEEADTCILIRSAVLCNGMLYWQTGAGIVADSVPEKEYDETIAKALSIRKVLDYLKSLPEEGK